MKAIFINVRSEKMKLQKKSRWILFGVFLVLLLIGVGYTSLLRQDNSKQMKNALPVQIPETSIKHAVLQELSQEKKAFSLLGNAQVLSQNRPELRLPYEK